MGHGYRTVREPDARLAEKIVAALGDSQTERHGYLLEQAELEVGLRLITSDIAA
jgi:hypothetical protein